MALSVSNSSQPPENAYDITILGAGLSGLSCAWHLHQQGVASVVFEKESFVGGHAHTIQEAGYSFDRTGHLLHLRNPELREQVLSWLNHDVYTIQRQSRVFSQGVYTHYPYQANTFGLPPETAYECVMGFLEAKQNPPTVLPTNFQDYCLAHFGEGFCKHFMIPYNERLWGVHPSEITSEWCQRFVPLPETSDVIAGSLGVPKRELGYNANFIYPKKGIGMLANAIANEVPFVQYNQAPTRIDWQQQLLYFGERTQKYQSLVSTMPLRVLGTLLDGIPAPVREAFSNLRCTHLYYLDVALSEEILQDIHWIYVPEAHYPFYRVGCYSHFSPEMAPPGCSNLYIELADRSPPDLEQLLPQIEKALVEMKLISSPEAIRFIRTRLIEHAYVIYDHNYTRSVQLIHNFLIENRIFSVGRYGSWNYSSMEDALLFGQQAAQSVLALR
jgi:protoporphyrinogen oxidase